ncbi:WD repeat-containing and planar cell polarity effector protein fritz homolog [Sitophilus oryzae]|uniref:WD repeat-containing and planar cell polarity effector protein fritz homolog n=1 Tax=Sitophilus oryzae TaxID=7048 RepID=A0A6J2X7R5_SITOR|nr:WD repeat-containing and planar cell polarity effector protein fritz homolog [Sitophilus oryzae]
MLSFLSEIHFWTTQEDVVIKDSDYGSYKYFLKKDLVDTVYAQAKRHFAEQVGITYVPNNKRPEKLRERLKELEEYLLHNKIVYYSWETNRLRLLLSTGLIVDLTIHDKTGDLLSIRFEKHLSAKLQVNIICDGVLFDSQVICVCNDGHVFGFGGPWKDGWVLDGGPRRKLHYSNEWLVVYGKAGVEHPQPWSPLAKDHQRANLHLYWIGLGEPELLAYKKTDGEPLLVVVSKKCNRTIIVIEQKVTQKGSVSVEVSTFELIANNLKRISITSVPLQTQVSCCSLSDEEDRLLLGCIDGSLALLNRIRGFTRTVKAAFIATLATWHPNGVVVAIANERGHLQYYDTALNCIKSQLSSEDYIPTTLLDLSTYFNTQFNVVSINWGTKDLVISLEQGPLCILTHVDGTLSFKALAFKYIKLEQMEKAIKLLLSWEFNDEAFYILQNIIAHLLRKPITEETAQYLQDALGCFHSPPAPLPSQIRHKFGHQVMSLTRRFFHHLVRAHMFETAFLLAVDVGHHDLFMDLHYIAVKIGETEMAAAARAQASALLSRCSSDASNCSPSSCSQCSDSESCSSDFDEDLPSKSDSTVFSSNEPSAENILTTNFNQPNPMTYKVDQKESQGNSFPKKPSPAKATYIKAPQIPSDFVKLNQPPIPSIPPLPFYTSLGIPYARQYNDGTPNKKTSSFLSNIYGISTSNPTNLLPNPSKPEPNITAELKPPPLPVVPSLSSSAWSRNHHQFGSHSTLPDVTNNSCSFNENFFSPKNPQQPNSKKPTPKVTFSNTVTAFIVSDEKKNNNDQRPNNLSSSQRELAESLPLCHPNEDYLKDFTPAANVDNSEKDGASQQPKIKVVHFGVV